MRKAKRQAQKNGHMTIDIKQRVQLKNNAWTQMSTNFKNQSLETAYSILGSFHLFIDDVWLFKVRDKVFERIIKDHTFQDVEITQVQPSPQYPSGIKASLEVPGKRSYHLDHIVGNERLTLTMKNPTTITKSALPKTGEAMLKYVDEVFDRIENIIKHLDIENR